MYKIGDKVEYLNNVWEVCDCEIDSVEIYNEKMGVNIYVPIGDVKPYRTAHEKLIEMGYELTINGPIWRTYQTEDLRNAIFFDRLKNTVNTNLHYDKTLSRILTQYLEEMK